jgi:hypothetical protein
LKCSYAGVGLGFDHDQVNCAIRRSFAVDGMRERAGRHHANVDAGERLFWAKL